MREYDESDVRIRPGKGSRPRTKIRPAHADAVIGVVSAVARGRYRVDLPDKDVLAVSARELGRRALVVGDKVAVVGDLSGRTGTMARIVRREERRNQLTRTADDADPTERTIVANVDLLAIVAALANPAPNERMIDRAIVAASAAGIPALLVLTKSDLAAPTALAHTYAPLTAGIVAVSPVTSAADTQAQLLPWLKDRTTVLIGASGVGKSTLVNAMARDADRRVGHVNEVTGRGRHTSTSAVRLPLAAGGWVIDTPGLRSFGLAHVTAADILAAFPDIAAASTSCPRGCNHLTSPGCALDALAAADPQRLDSVRRLLHAQMQLEDAGETPP